MLPLIVWSFGCVTEWVRAVSGPADVTALFVTECASTAPPALVGTLTGHAMVGFVTAWVSVAEGFPDVTALLVMLWTRVAFGLPDVALEPVNVGIEFVPAMVMDVLVTHAVPDALVDILAVVVVKFVPVKVGAATVPVAVTV